MQIKTHSNQPSIPLSRLSQGSTPHLLFCILLFSFILPRDVFWSAPTESSLYGLQPHWVDIPVYSGSYWWTLRLFPWELLTSLRNRHVPGDSRCQRVKGDECLLSEVSSHVSLTEALGSLRLPAILSGFRHRTKRKACDPGVGTPGSRPFSWPPVTLARVTVYKPQTLHLNNAKTPACPPTWKQVYKNTRKIMKCSTSGWWCFPGTSINRKGLRHLRIE